MTKEDEESKAATCLTPEQYASMILVRDRVEKDILWKYSVGGLSITGAVLAVATLAYIVVTKMADDKLASIVTLQQAYFDSAKRFSDQAHNEEQATAERQRQAQDSIKTAEAKVKELDDRSVVITDRLQAGELVVKAVKESLDAITTVTSTLSAERRKLKFLPLERHLILVFPLL